MTYGAQEDDRMTTPETEEVEWIGYDKTKVNGVAQTVSCMAKTWFAARTKIDLILHPQSLGDLKVMRGGPWEIPGGVYRFRTSISYQGGVMSLNRIGLQLEQYEKDMVERLKVAMLKKLSKNRYKHHWGNMDFRYLSVRMRNEFKEVAEAWKKFNKSRTEVDRQALIDECADVANFAGMIADIACREEL